MSVAAIGRAWAFHAPVLSDLVDDHQGTMVLDFAL
jgi:hypothetical protein